MLFPWLKTSVDAKVAARHGCGVARIQIVTAETFHRERRWFALGLAALTFTALLPLALAEVVRLPAGLFLTWLFVAPSAAIGMGVAAFAAYALTTRFKAPLASGRAWDVVLHLIVIPVLALPIGGFVFGVFALTDERGSEFVWVVAYAIYFGAIFLGIPCLAVTAVWSIFFLYVVRPKYAVIEVSDSKEGSASHDRPIAHPAGEAGGVVTTPGRKPPQPLPTDWVDLGGGRVLPRDLDRVRKRSLLVLTVAALWPFALLIALSVVPASAMLTIASALHDLGWLHSRQMSFQDCGDRCWARAYTSISASFMWVGVAVVGALALREGVRSFRWCEDVLRRGGSPFGLTSRGTIAQGPKRWAYVVLPLCVAVGLALLIWLGAVIHDTAGADWRRGLRGVQSPALRSFLYTGVLVIVQVLAIFVVALTVSAALHIWKALHAEAED